MTRIITIEIQNDQDFDLMKGLAQRLGLQTKESFLATNTSKTEQEAAFKKFAGSWQGDESADELVDLIYSARHDSPREIEL